MKQTEIYERNKRAMATIKCLTAFAAVTVFVPNLLLTGVYAAVVNFQEYIFSTETLSIIYRTMLINSIMNVFVYLLHVKEFKKFYTKNELERTDVVIKNDIHHGQ